MIKLNTDVKTILNCLTEKGYEAYVVGGAIRSLLLNTEPTDYDITTSATPEEILNVFSFTKTIPTGIKYGTITVLYNHQKYEITTYRIDGRYSNNRHPENVKFTKSLENDLMRRDFTINALAYNDKLIDLFNGIDDLNSKVIRSIGNSDKRFEEDALRIIRAIRFSCKLNFEIEYETKKSIHKNKELLIKIPIERINSELFELFKYINIETIYEFYDVFQVMFPHLKRENIDRIINKVKNINNDPLLILSSFFIDVNINDFNNVINNYKLSNEYKKIIKFITKNHDLPSDVIGYQKLLKNWSFSDIMYYISFNIFDNVLKENAIKLLEEANKKCHNLKMLDINGNDLVNMGYNGQIIKVKLNKLLDAVIEEKVKNNKSDLLYYLTKL